jgi:hypothetical protein
LAITLKARLSAKNWLPKLALATAFGLSGPAAARSAADKRNAALRQALALPDVTARIVANGA